MATKDSRSTIISKIKQKFPDYKIEVATENAKTDIVHIKRNNMYPIDLKLKIKEMEDSDKNIISIYFGDTFYRDCLAFYTEDIKEVLEKINNDIKTYFEFLHYFIDGLDISKDDDEYYLNYLIENNGTLYLKNKKNGRILYIEPAVKIDSVENIKRRYIELIVKSLFCGSDKVLMNIYIPAANVEDTCDSLLFFLC